MYQLFCHVNVTADRAILDFVPGMKRTVVIAIKYYDNFNDFGAPLSVRDLVLFTIPNREAETVAIFNAKDIGRNGPRVQQATIYYVRVNPRLSASKCARLRNPTIPRPPRDEVKVYLSVMRPRCVITEKYMV